MIKADDPEKTKVEQIATLKSTQEETDSRIIVYRLQYACKHRKLQEGADKKSRH